jgi:hypothetical protein
MASKLVVRSVLAQIQVLWPTTQLEKLVEENTMKLTIRPWTKLKMD